MESFSADKGGRPQAAEGELPALVLLSDRTTEVVDAYGVKPLEINGATYASRATFVGGPRRHPPVRQLRLPDRG